MAAALIMTLLLLGAFSASLLAHPHITRAEAAERLREAEAAVQELLGLHDGVPAADHADGKRWAELQVRLAECHFLLGDVKRALIICNEVVDFAPAFPDGYSMRRAVYQFLGQAELADADALRYLELGAGNPTLAYELARRPVPEENPQEAAATRKLQLQLIEAARQRWPEDASLLTEQLRLLLLVDRERLQSVAGGAYQLGTDAQRVTVVAALRDSGGDALLRDFLRRQDHQWVATPPAKGGSGPRLELGVLYQQSGLNDLAQQAATAALVTLRHEEEAVEYGEMMAAFLMQGIRGDRARAFALLGRWQEALEIVDGLLAEYQDPLTWLAARAVCLRQLGDEAAAQAAIDDFTAFFTDIGMEAPEELPAWP